MGFHIKKEKKRRADVNGMYKNDNTLFLQYNVYIDLSSILCFLSFLADTLTIFKQHLLNKAIYGLCITK